jgi:hypothetical protein
MKKRILCIIVQALLSVTFTMTVQASNLYTVGVNSAGTSYDFGKIDTTTGAYTAITLGFATQFIGNLTLQGNNIFYAYDEGTTTPGLRTIDTNGFLSPVIANPGLSLYGMVYRASNNTIYAYNFNKDEYGALAPGTGAWTPLTGSGTGFVASVGATNGSGRLAILNDVVYAAIYDKPTTPDRGLFSSFGFSSQVLTTTGSGGAVFMDMALASDGAILYGITGNGVTGPGTLYTIDPVSGTVTGTKSLTGTVPYAFTGVAGGP